jgi:glycosyltransferase involved in cell wall biosynthesis
VADRVRWLGYASQDELAAFYSGALALAYPSLMEGFGLPPMEAMVCGAPVITTDVAAMSEVYAGAAIFVPVRSPGEIAAAAERLLADEPWRETWRQRGFAHAARFSWEKAAAETVAVYQEAARMERRGRRHGA